MGALIGASTPPVIWAHGGPSTLNKTVSEMAVVERKAGTIRGLWRANPKYPGSKSLRKPRGMDVEEFEMRLISYHMANDKEGVIEVITPGKKQSWQPFAVWITDADADDMWEY